MMHKSLKKFTKLERAEIRKQKLKNALAGEGKFMFQNNTSGELELPKLPTGAVSKKIPKNGKFIGDSYFLQMVRTNDLKLIETILEETEPMNKLITEQPPTVTSEGTVEYVEPANGKKLHEGIPQQDDKQKEVLLTEDPLGGVVIVD